METIVQLPYEATVKLMLASLERNLLPDAVIRRLTRLLLASRLRSSYKPSSEQQLSDLLQFVHSLKEMPIAVNTEAAKSQHYELPTSFFKLVLGKHFKYSTPIGQTGPGPGTTERRFAGKAPWTKASRSPQINTSRTSAPQARPGKLELMNLWPSSSMAELQHGWLNGHKKAKNLKRIRPAKEGQNLGGRGLGGKSAVYQPK